MKGSNNNFLKFWKVGIVLIFLTFSIHGQTVYKTPSGAKYHRESCRTVKNVSEAISIKEALKKGLSPCKICKPPVSNSGSSANTFVSTPNKAKGEDEAVQCKGKTKKGIRCKRMTKIADGYCFQHKPK